MPLCFHILNVCCENLFLTVWKRAFVASGLISPNDKNTET
jgi:hypothetical protein